MARIKFTPTLEIDTKSSANVRLTCGGGFDILDLKRIKDLLQKDADD